MVLCSLFLCVMHSRSNHHEGRLYENNTNSCKVDYNETLLKPNIITDEVSKTYSFVYPWLIKKDAVQFAAALLSNRQNDTVGGLDKYDASKAN
jgi:hypothetical protein